MAKSIYGFAKSAAQSAPGGGGTAVTAAKRRYDTFIDRNANEDGVVNNPNVYKEAREKFLKPYASDLQIQKKMAASVRDQSSLEADLEAVYKRKNFVESQMNNEMASLQQSNYNAPGDLVVKQHATYQQYLDKIGTEIEKARANGQSPTSLESLYSEVQTKARELQPLADSYVGNRDMQNPNAYGWFIDTHPDTGEITNIEVKSVDSRVSKEGFIQTDTKYGGVPVWTTTQLNDDGERVAKLGDYKYEYEKNSEKPDRMRFVDDYSWNPFSLGGAPELGENRSIKLNEVDFSSPTNLPKGAVAKDPRGNYYYSDGNELFNADSKKAIEKQTGRKIPETQIMRVTSDQAAMFGQLQESRDQEQKTISEDAVEGTMVPENKKQSSAFAPVSSQLPGMNQTLDAVFKTGGGNNLASATERMQTSVEPFQVPRKEPRLNTQEREVTSGGQYSAKDVMADEQEEIINNQNIA